MNERGTVGLVVVSLLVIVSLFTVSCNSTLPSYTSKDVRINKVCGGELETWDMKNISNEYSYLLQRYVTHTEKMKHYSLANSLTIVIPTIPSHSDEHRRRLHKHYSSCSVVHHILWVWNSPEPVSSYLVEETRKNSYVLTNPKHKYDLLNRFVLYPEIKTNIIMSLDDDHLVDCRGLIAGVKIIKDNPGQYVSFAPRLISCIKSDWAYIWDGSYKTGNYNFGLTSEAITDRSFLTQFWQNKPSFSELYSLVSKEKNCEDILFAFMHWHVHKTPAVIIHWDGIITILQREGLSTRKSHSHGRDVCVRRFIKAFGRIPGLAKGLVAPFSQKQVKRKEKLTI